MGVGIFLIARSPEEDSKLPYLLRLPIEGGLVLKAETPGQEPTASTATPSNKAGPMTPR